MGFEYRVKDSREAEKLQKLGGHLIEIKGSEIPFEPKTYIFSETYSQVKKMLGQKVEEKKEEVVEEVKEEQVVIEEKPKQKRKGKGGKK
jgi:hypothetical protein